MKLSEITQLLKTQVDVKQDMSVLGIAQNADQVRAGFIFVALKGTIYNGADFIKKAEQNGCVAVIVDQEVKTTVPVIRVENARHALAVLAKAFYPAPDLKKVAVTGTNGKTSTVYFVKQLMNGLGVQTASLGTIGLDTPWGHFDSGNTTPGVLEINRIAHEVADKGGQVLAMEASSHGLDQGRLDGIQFEAAAFTNLTRDHLDYHKTMEAYFNAKTQLFLNHLKPEGVAVLNADIPEYEVLLQKCIEKKNRVLSYGHQKADLQIINQVPTENGQQLTLKLMNQTVHVLFPVVGDFQVMNCLAAIGLCLAIGADLDKLVQLIPTLKAPVGRMDLIAELENGAKVYVDYAHTPDAVERVLISLRAHTKGRLICLIGCGGNRDKGKRPQMGAIAQKLADMVYITDDNPRFENPAEIRAEIKAACPKGIEVAHRSDAIRQAMRALEKNDVLAVLGKGHESGQIIQGISYAFNDAVIVRQIALALKKTPLWSAKELQMALSVPVSETLKVWGVSIDTRTLKMGDLYIAIKGDKMDGHQFVHEALEKGAVACLVDHKISDVLDENQIIVSDTVEAFKSLARFARMRSDAVFIGITGSSGKTTTKEMLRACLAEQGLTHATAGNLNNQLGVPLTLTNMPLEVQYAVIEMGMSHAGELTELSDLVRPDMTLITMVGPAHFASFKDEAEIAAAKAEIFRYQNRYGTAVLNRDNSFYQFFADEATKQGIKNITSFGVNQKADFILKDEILENDLTHVLADFHGTVLSYTLNFVGHHFVMNSLAVLAMVDAVGASVMQAVKSLERVFPVAGRGALIPVSMKGKKFFLIDDAYNANPSSVKASLNSLGMRQISGRKIAVLGDMLELGPQSTQMHLDLKKDIMDNQIDKVYATGQNMETLYQALPVQKQGAFEKTPRALLERLRTDIEAGDIVLVKASNGSGLKVIVDGLLGKE